MYRFTLIIVLALLSGIAMGDTKSLFDLSATTIDGRTLALSEFSGKVVLVANTASKCGFTPQYKGLEQLFNSYKDRGFVVLGFPSNDFLWQEPGTNEEIKSFCESHFGVSFPLFAKAPVTGSAKQAVFKFLTEEGPADLQGRVLWNFEKFLVGRDGRLAARFRSRTEPTSFEIVEQIERLL